MPTDDVGRVIVVDFGRESVSQPVPRDELGKADDEGPDNWQPIGDVAQRILKRSIVSAGMRGSISRRHAHRLIARLDLRRV